MTERASDLWKKIKPFAVRDLSDRITTASSGGSGGGSGVTDHGILEGLEDDDHPHYLTTARGDARYSLLNHDIITDHDHSGGAGQLVGVNTSNELAYITPVSDGKTNPSVVLDTDSNGDLTLRYLTADKVISGEIETSTLLLDTSVETTWKTAFNSSNYVSATTGIGMDETLGLIDARKIQADELIVETFTAAVKRALAGALIVSVSESLTSRQITLPSNYTNTTTLYVWDIPGHTKMAAFKNNSWVMIPFSRTLSTGDPLTRVNRRSEDNATSFLEGTGTISYLSDDFEGYNEGDVLFGDWFATGNSNSTVQSTTHWDIDDISGDLVLRTKSAAASSHVHYAPDGVHPTWANVSFTGKLRISDLSGGWGITAYSQYPDADRYVRVRQYKGGDVEVAPHGYSDPVSGTTSFTPSLSVDTWYNFRMEVEADGSDIDLRFRMWTGTEPGTWQIDCTFSGTNKPIPGTVGFWGHTSFDGVYFNDIAVDSISSSTVPATTVVTIDIDNDHDNYMFFVVSWKGSNALSSVPTGVTQLDSNRTVNGYTSAIYYKAVTSEDGPTSYSFTANSADDELTVSGFTIQGMSGVPYSPYYEARNSVTDWTSGYSYSNIDANLYVNIKHDMQSAFQQTPFASQTAAFYYNPPNTIAHLASVAVPEENRMPSNLVINYEPESGVYWEIKLPLAFPDGEATGLHIGRAYGTVTWIDPQPAGLEDGEQAWTLDLLSSYQFFNTKTGQYEFTPDSDGRSVSIPADTPVINIGEEGDGVVDITTLDAKGSPYMQFALAGKHPAEQYRDVKFRAGQLRGITGYDSFGMWAGHNGAELEISSRIARMTNIPFRLSDGPTVDTIIDPARGIRLRALEYETNSVAVESTRGIDFATDTNLSQSSVFASLHALINASDNAKIYSTVKATGGATKYATNALYAINPSVSGGALGFDNQAWIEVRSPNSSIGSDISLRADQVTVANDLRVSGDVTIDDGTTTNHFFSEDSGANSYVCADGGNFLVGTSTDSDSAVYIDNSAIGENFGLRIKPASTFTTPTILINNTDNGSGDGPYIRIGYNNNGSTAAPSSIVLYQADGGASTLWVDNSGDLREAELSAGGVSSGEINGGERVGEQSSSEQYKLLQRHVGADRWADALERVQVAAEQSVYEFTYKKDQWKDDPEVFQGVVLERGAAHYGMDRDADKFPVGRSLNVVNAVADLMQAVAEINRKLEAM